MLGAPAVSSQQVRQMPYGVEGGRVRNGWQAKTLLARTGLAAVSVPGGFPEGRRDQAVRSVGPGVSLLTTTGAGVAGGSSLLWIASHTSWRCTGTSLGATMPSRTLSPRISTTVTVMSLLMTILSFFFLDSTSIAAYPSQSRGGRSCEAGSHATTAAL